MHTRAGAQRRRPRSRAQCDVKQSDSHSDSDSDDVSAPNVFSGPCVDSDSDDLSGPEESNWTLRSDLSLTRSEVITR